jgi:hypothetical protein
MYNVYRRGSASICRIVRRTPVPSVQILRFPAPSLITRNALGGAITSKSFHVSAATRRAAAATQNQQPSYDSTESVGVPTLTQFKELVDHKLVHPNIVRAIVDDMGHHTMTDVQRLTIRDTLRGIDV